jgi:hypothetical protein
VVNHSICPAWNEGFTWLFDVAPKGQKLYIICKSKNTFGKVWPYVRHIFFTSFLFLVNACTSYVTSQMLLFLFQSTLGRVTIQIDKVVTEGVYSGFFSLSHDGGKDGSRTLEIEIVWSNRPSNDSM